MLESVENRKSALRRSNPRAPRLAVWKDILSTDGAFLQKMAAAVGLGACGAGLLGSSRCMNDECVDWGRGKGVD